ncbi:MAG: hypothetical protein ACT4NT_01185 [Nitrososphaerota archaeon]
MSQMLVGRPKSTVLYSEIYFQRKANVLCSSATEATCHLCKQELKEGIRLTAQRVDGSIVLVCELHN